MHSTLYRLRIQYILQQNLGRLVYSEENSRDGLPSRCARNRSAHRLIPPLRLTNCTSDSDGVFCTRAYRNARDHLDRVRCPPQLERRNYVRLPSRSGWAEAATDMFDLQPPRHISALHWAAA